jgi:uncharacterized delta-60 repeat protein
VIRYAVCAALAALPSIAGAMVIDPVDPAYGFAIAEFPVSPSGWHAHFIGTALAPGGRVAVLTVQEGTQSGCPVVTMVMFGENGAIDAAFGQDGRASSAMLGLPPCAGAAGLAIGQDGAIFFMSGDVSSPTSSAVWKARADGRADTSFGNRGSALVPGVDGFTRPTLQVLADGGVAIGGTARLAGTETWGLAVVRLRPNGSPDTAYGSGGLAFAVPPNRPIFVQQGGGMAVNADGSALVAGNIFEDDAGARTYTDATVARFDARGVLDKSYGQGGFAIPLPDASTYVQSLAVRDGVAYLSGVQNRDVKSVFVVKVDANGRVDLRYGDAGVAGTYGFYETNFHPIVAVDQDHRAYYLILEGHLLPRVTRLTRDGTPDATFGLDGSAYPTIDGWRFDWRGDLRLAEDGRLYVVADDVTPLDGANRAAIAVMRFKDDGGHRDGIAGGTAVIYYNASLDHYFLTANPAEQALLDNGITPGWRRRTGEEFRVVTSAALEPELSPVCRYYGRPEAHLDSHFFSAAPDECAAVAQKFSASWLLETSQAFQVHLPDRTTGACPRGSLKIFRAFNNRADANHYYGWFAPASPSGWTYEGYGPGPIPTAFCAPLL